MKLLAREGRSSHRLRRPTPCVSLPVCHVPKARGRNARGAGCSRSKRKAKAVATHHDTSETELGGKTWQREIEAFDWSRQWYPMGFRADFRENKFNLILMIDLYEGTPYSIDMTRVMLLYDM